MSKIIALLTVLATLTILPSANAAVKPAGIARVGDQCLRNGVIAEGRGINSTNLICMPANLGSSAGELLWWYPNLKQQNIFELIAPITSRSSDPADVIASRSADKIAKILGQSLKSEQLIKDYSNKNFTSSYGQLALSTFQSYRNRSATSFIANTNLFSALISEKSPINLLDSKPIANMIIEYEAIAVSSNSRYSSVTQLMNDLSNNPKSVTFLGGPRNGFDYYFLRKLLAIQNIDFKNISYIETSSGAQLANLLNGDSSKVAISSNGNFVSGVNAAKTKILGIASPERLSWIKGKTLVSQGIDLVNGNRYGVMAPSYLNSVDFDNMLRSLEILHNSKVWIKALQDNYWSDNFLYPSDYLALLNLQRDEFVSFRN
jgi:putative tricarboxylic transport membrane protein